MGVDSRKAFDDVVGGDDRVDRLVAVCDRNGFMVGFSICGNSANVDVLHRGTCRPVVVYPYMHTFTLDLDTDEITLLGEHDFDDGIRYLENIFADMTGETRASEGFIDEMRSL